jgi:hypothetical protein
MVYKFVSQEASGTWQWCAHRQCQSGFPSERMAAQDLAHRLRIPAKDLRADANVKGRTTPALPEELAGYPVLWNPEKCGWYTKLRRMYYIEARQVVKDGKLKKKPTKRQKITDRPGPWRQFKGITCLPPTQGYWHIVIDIACHIGYSWAGPVNCHHRSRCLPSFASNTAPHLKMKSAELSHASPEPRGRRI